MNGQGPFHAGVNPFAPGQGSRAVEPVQVAAESSYPLGTRVPYANIGYRFFGGPALVDLRDGFTTSIGTTKQIGKAVLIASDDDARAPAATTKNAHELFVAQSKPVSEALNLTGNWDCRLEQGKF